MYDSDRFQLPGYALIRQACFYYRRHLKVRWCKDCCFYMYASIKAVSVRACLCKYCSFYIYVSMMVTVLRICFYKTGMLM